MYEIFQVCAASHLHAQLHLPPQARNRAGALEAETYVTVNDDTLFDSKTMIIIVSISIVVMVVIIIFFCVRIYTDRVKGVLVPAVVRNVKHRVCVLIYLTENGKLIFFVAAAFLVRCEEDCVE